MSSELSNFFLSLVRLGVGNATRAVLPKDVDWSVLEDLAAQQGLSAILVDGIELLPENYRPPNPVLLQWIGETLQGYEYRYELYRRAIAEISSFYNQHGFKMMVLKGYACSLDWPKPEHRPCGDIDIWLFGKQKEADSLLVKEKGININGTHHHHTVFNWHDFTVENHYDFVNVFAHKSNRDLEKVFKELGKDDTHFFELYGEKVYLPSPNLHALFLLRHLVSHFAAAEISLRQVLDWAFFVEKHNNEVNWDWLNMILNQYYMRDFVACVNAICIENLGFASHMFHCGTADLTLKNRILIDILYPRFVSSEPHNFIPRMIYKYHRWKGNAWKQKLCYKESRFSSFCTGLWAKLLKPASF